MPDQDAFQAAVTAIYTGIKDAATSKEWVLQSASALRELQHALQIRASIKPEPKAAERL
jgi:hypothetical protein